MNHYYFLYCLLMLTKSYYDHKIFLQFPINCIKFIISEFNMSIFILFFGYNQSIIHPLFDL